jgi:branched-chain amino acid transport system permease protein
MWSFIAVMVLFGIFLWIFNSTKVGLGMRSVAEDTTVAQLKGVKARQIQTLAWFIAGITAVIGGIFLGYRYGINSTLSLLGLKAFPVVFLGGLESIPGVIVGGLVIGMAESLTGGYISSGWVDIVPFIILLVVMALRPEGIFGQRRVERI